MFEPVHGSAPDIAGTGTANPLGAIESAAMLLEYTAEIPEAARLVRRSVSEVLASGARTRDIAREADTQIVSTEEMGSLVADKITSEGGESSAVSA